MSRSGYSGPKLPRFLLDQVQDGNVSKRKQIPRKDRRKNERQQKKSARAQPRAAPGIGRRAQAVDLEEEDDLDEAEDLDSSPEPAPKRVKKDADPPKSILKRTKKNAAASSESSSQEDSEADEQVQPVVSRATRERLADDDAEIAALEKKLGLKGRKKSKALDEDGLNGLLEGGSSGSDEEGHGGVKGKSREYEDWLREKRRKAGDTKIAKPQSRRQPEPESETEDEEEDEDEDGDEIVENPFSEDEIDSDDFGDSESQGDEYGDDVDHSDEDEDRPVKRQRENPYVAPVSRDAAPPPKYIPPSLRKPAASDEEALKQLRRQIQGLLNRLSESNMLSILRSMEEVYEKNARQHVTSTLVDLLIGLVSDAAILNDTFLILHAGFATAVYKVVGPDFGAQVLARLVETFDIHHNSAGTDGKQSLNLLAFLSCLYTFQLVGHAIVFDYIRNLLSTLTENNTELLLRIIRTSGPQLRSDDPSALKDIVLLLQRSVAAQGEANLSVRTKFMIETINNLKNNRMKTGLTASTLTAEHTSRMKKALGTLNARPTKASEPLRISLADIRDTEKKGKWWLVGASYHDPSKLARPHSNSAVADDPDNQTPIAETDQDPTTDDPIDTQNLTRLARAAGMNTPTRAALFTLLLTSTDYLEAATRIHKLQLKTKQHPEIARVLLHCVGAEATYNPYYALVAWRLMTSGTGLQKGVRRGLEGGCMRVIGGLVGHDSGEGMDSNEEDGEVDKEEWKVKKVVHLGKFFGALIAMGASTEAKDLSSSLSTETKRSGGSITLSVLKRVDFAQLGERTGMFLEVLVTSMLLRVRKLKGREGFEEGVVEVFATAKGAGSTVASGLRSFVTGTVANGELAGSKKERKILREGSEVADGALLQAAREAPGLDDEVDSEEDE